jgi:hypothetical protein
MASHTVLSDPLAPAAAAVAGRPSVPVPADVVKSIAHGVEQTLQAPVREVLAVPPEQPLYVRVVRAVTTLLTSLTHAAAEGGSNHRNMQVAMATQGPGSLVQRFTESTALRNDVGYVRALLRHARFDEASDADSVLHAVRARRAGGQGPADTHRLTVGGGGWGAGAQLSSVENMLRFLWGVGALSTVPESELALLSTERARFLQLLSTLPSVSQAAPPLTPRRAAVAAGGGGPVSDWRQRGETTTAAVAFPPRPAPAINPHALHRAGRCKPCRHFLKGRCNHGDSCNFCHDQVHNHDGSYEALQRDQQAAAAASATAAATPTPYTGYAADRTHHF